MATFLQPPLRPNSLIDMMIWYSILYLKGVIIMGLLFLPLYFYHVAIYWLLSVLFTIAFSGFGWARQYYKLYEKWPAQMSRLKASIATYFISLFTIAIVFLIESDNPERIAIMMYEEPELFIGYALGSSFVMHLFSFRIGAFLYAPDYHWGRYPFSMYDGSLESKEAMQLNDLMVSNTKWKIISVIAIYIIVAALIYLK